MVEWVEPGVKRPGRGVNHPLPPSAEVKETVQLFLYSTSGPSWLVPGRSFFYDNIFVLENIFSTAGVAVKPKRSEVSGVRAR